MRRIGANLGGLAFGNVASMALGLATVAYLARTLGQTGFGKFAYAQTIAAYAALFADLGLNTFGARAVAKDRRLVPLLLYQIPVAQVVAGILFALAIVAASLLGAWEDRDTQWLIWLSILWVIPYALNVEWVFFGVERMGTIGTSRLFQQGAILLLTVLIVQGPEQLLWAPVLRTLGGLLSALWLFYALRRVVEPVTERVQIGSLGHHFRSSRWFWMSGFLVQVYNGSDVLILEQTQPAAEVGLYAAGFRLIGLFTAAIALINSAMFPILSAESKRGAVAFGHYRKVFLLLSVLIAVAVMAGGVTLSSVLIEMLYGVEYLPAVPALQILITAAAVLTVNGALAQPLLALGHERAVFFQILMTALVNVSANLLLAPRYGAVGAALAYLIASVFATVWVGVLYRRWVVAPLGATA